jgi:hypothetical protein
MDGFALHIQPCAEKRSLICLGCSPSAVRAAMITTFKRDGGSMTRSGPSSTPSRYVTSRGPRPPSKRCAGGFANPARNPRRSWRWPGRFRRPSRRCVQRWRSCCDHQPATDPGDRRGPVPTWICRTWHADSSVLPTSCISSKTTREACTCALQWVWAMMNPTASLRSLGMSVSEESRHESYGDTNCHRSLLRSHGSR